MTWGKTWVLFPLIFATELVIHNPVVGNRNSNELSVSPAPTWVEVRRAQVPTGMAVDVFYAVRRAVKFGVQSVLINAEAGGSGLCGSAIFLALPRPCPCVFGTKSHHGNAGFHPNLLARAGACLLSATHGKAVFSLFHHERGQIDLAVAGIAQLPRRRDGDLFDHRSI